MIDYKVFYHAAEQVLTKAEFDRVTSFIELQERANRVQFPEIYARLDMCDAIARNAGFKNMDELKYAFEQERKRVEEEQGK